MKTNQKMKTNLRRAALIGILSTLPAAQSLMACNVAGQPQLCQDFGNSHCVSGSGCGSVNCTYGGLTITYYTGLFVSGKVYKTVAYDNGDPNSGLDSTTPNEPYITGHQVTVANCVATSTDVIVLVSACDGTDPSGNPCQKVYAMQNSPNKKM